MKNITVYGSKNDEPIQLGEFRINSDLLNGVETEVGKKIADLYKGLGAEVHSIRLGCACDTELL